MIAFLVGKPKRFSMSEKMNMNQNNNQQSARTNQKNQPTGPSAEDVMQELNMIGRRLRVLEERYSGFDKRMQVSEQNMISNHRNMNTEIKTTMEDIKEIKKEIYEVKDKLRLIILEMKNFARKEDVKVIEKYVNLWEPVNFVTRNQVEKIVNEILNKEDISKKEDKK